MYNEIISSRLLIYLSLFQIGCVFVGCSDEQQNAVRQRRDNLAKVGQAYIDMNREAGGSPRNSDALAAWMAGSADPVTREEARDCVLEGEVVVNWNGDFSDPGKPKSAGDLVLAFEAAAPARGGYVVMADGRVEYMPLKTFQESEMLPQLQP